MTKSIRLRTVVNHPYAHLTLPSPQVLIPYPTTLLVRENLEFLSDDPKIAAVTALTMWLENGCQSTCRLGYHLLDNWPHIPLLVKLPHTVLHTVLVAWADQHHVHTSNAALWGLLHEAGNIWHARHPDAPRPTADESEDP